MKWIIGILVVALTAGTAFGAGQRAATTDEIVEITHMVADRGLVPPEVGSLEDNWYLDTVNERLSALGIRVGVQVFPRGEYDSRVATMMAARTAPDVMWTWSFPQIGEWTQQGGLLDYGPYLDEFGPNIRALYTPEDLMAGTFYDKLTTLKRIQTPAQWGFLTFARQDYLDTLGLDAPRSVDELYDVLVTLKENAHVFGQDPREFYPFAVRQTSMEWQRFVLPAFTSGRPDPERLAIPPQLWPEAKDALRFLNRLYNEGLMPDLTLDTDDSIWKQMIISGQTAIYPYWTHGPIFTGYGRIYENAVRTNPEAEFVPIFAWAQDSDEPYYHDFYGNSRYGLGFITPSATRHPQQVVQYLDYLASEEGYQTVTMGIEGEHWERTQVGGFRRLVDEETVSAMIGWIQPGFETLSLAFRSAALNAQALYGGMAYSDEYVEWTDQIEQFGNHPAPVVNLPTPARDRYFAVIEGDWNDALAGIITAPETAFDQRFDAAIAEYLANGGAEVRDEAIANYREFYNN